jgi:hypothetical protein
MLLAVPALGEGQSEASDITAIQLSKLKPSRLRTRSGRPASTIRS